MNTVPAHALGVVVEHLADELALLRPDAGEVVLLNSSAAEIWLACDGRQSLSAVIEDLAGRHTEAPALEAQVVAVVDDLVTRGFLTVTHPLCSRDSSSGFDQL